MPGPICFMMKDTVGMGRALTQPPLDGYKTRIVNGPRAVCNWMKKPIYIRYELALAHIITASTQI